MKYFFLIKNSINMMKIKLNLIATALVVLGFASQSFGQATGSADVFATIVAPLTITKVTDMNFGNLAVQSFLGGTVALDPAGTRTPAFGVTAASGGTVSAATFTVTGAAGMTYSITLPGAPIDLSDGLGNFMSVSDYTVNPATGTLTGGTQNIAVGAQLYVSANQTPGTYTSTSTLDVVVNYN
jgi:hypothetical protein